MPVIVVVGGGFAGIAVARRLERRLRTGEAEIVLLSRDNYTLFTPMLPEVTSGELEVRHVVTPIREQLARTRFVLADVDQIDVARREIMYHHVLTGVRTVQRYDHLVLALGSSTSTFDLPGVAEYTWPLKRLKDADALRNHLVWLLELADTIADAQRRLRLLTLVVVGGGFTGVETAGEIVELFRSVLRFYKRLRFDEVRMILVEAGPSLLAGLPPKMGQYSRRVLERRGVEVLLGDGVAGADDRGLALASGRRIETETIIWSAGVKPSPTIASIALPTTKRGAVMTERDMRVRGFDDVWALGDCAAIPDGAGGLFPMTAQHAIREGPHLADNVVAALRGKPTTPFRYRSLGMMAALGGRKAVAQLPGNLVITGFLAWFFWRTYYLLRLPGLDRKLRVAFDWTLELLFPRDTAELRFGEREGEEAATKR
ncbi:MAG: NAD(P)/FAD-dependent oxidoreductase [Candidatus Eremiobacteraeota bacterium]|nr:NAD(P)/FAD-dependent oxidoreductase [Candidatus Eremiobacteraeota bacterium]MBV8497985.1 NAD(P)/FAD-dependent oxidoreductase [Candidatus Eremiobacteraeota bacterium]